ncbi:MAG: hypothetical protein AAF639_05645 [Chloroflexota bacterium]
MNRKDQFSKSTTSYNQPPEDHHNDPLFGSTLPNMPMGDDDHFDYFAEAIDRFMEGEPLESVLASVPISMHAELQEMLPIVEMTVDIQAEPVPPMSAERREADLAEFFAEATRLRTAIEDFEPDVVTVPNTATGDTQQTQQTTGRFFDDIAQRFLNGLQSIFVPQGGGIPRAAAAIAVVVLAVLFSSFGVYNVADASEPGDLAYPLKQWIWEQELRLTPLDQRDEVLSIQQAEMAEDVINVIDRNDVVIQEQATLVYYGTSSSDRYKIGPFLVVPRYQSDANIDEYAPMDIIGELVEGASVELFYQILPGQGAGGGDSAPLVQGIQLRVIPPPVAIPTPTPTTIVTLCQKSQPGGWGVYQIRSGNTLSQLAAWGGTSVLQLMDVNCLESDVILAGEDIYVPLATINNSNSAASTPVPTATQPPTAAPTTALVATQAATLAATLTAVPTDEPTATPEHTATSTSIPVTTTAPITATVVTEPVVTEPVDTPEATSSPTPTVTREPVFTVVVTDTNLPVGDTPTVEVTPAPTIEATSVPTVTPAPVDTPVSTAEPTVEATTEPTVEPVVTEEATPTDIPVDTPTETPIVDDVATETPDETPQDGSEEATATPMVDDEVEPTATAVQDTDAPDTDTPEPMATLTADAGNESQPTVEPTPTVFEPEPAKASPEPPPPPTPVPATATPVVGEATDTATSASVATPTPKVQPIGGGNGGNAEQAQPESPLPAGN